MDWNKFNTHDESKENAFEILSNQIFKYYCEKEYSGKIKRFVPINGAGGDGGIESYAELKNGDVIAIQSKSFFDTITSSRIEQIRKSIKTAIEVRDKIKKYIVSIPRNLADKRNGSPNPEREKVNELFEEFAYTNIKFELWGEFELLNYLTLNEELAGVYKFWFENSEISFKTIKNSFDIQKDGWLKERYNEKLHVKNKINYEIEKIFGNPSYKYNQINKIKRIQEIYNNYIELFEKFIEIIKDDDKENADSAYKEHSNLILELNDYLNNLIQYLKNENIKLEFKENFNIDTEWFYSLKGNYKFLIHYSKIKNAVEKIDNIRLNRILKEIKDEADTRILMIRGELGSGKTHGVVNQIDNELKKDNIAILIRAIDINKDTLWRDILIKKLGLSNTWSEEEIFLALDSLAHRCEFRKNQECIINKKILICIDGIDECYDKEFWKEKQDEAMYLSQKYERLRFCFVGRPYAFISKKNINCSCCKELDYDLNPGYNMEEMYDKYIKEYGIKLEDSINVRTYLNNPLVLKMFCQEYSNKIIKNYKKIEVNLTRLFKIKLEEMNKEFIKNNPEVICEDAISRTAKLLVDYLYKNKKITQIEIFKFMNTDELLSFISYEQKNKIITSLQKYGLLDVEIIEEDSFKKNKYYYQGKQPVIDYILALNLSNDIINKRYDVIDNKIKNNPSVLRLTTLILFEENNIYLPDIKELNVEAFRVEDAIFYAIVNSSPSKSKIIKNKIKKILLKHPNNMRLILNNIIVPSSRIKDHALGVNFLDNILNNYKNMADRDKIWSLPEWLRETNISISEGVVINDSNPNYFLRDYDKYDGLPTIYTWLLSRTNNQELMFYRNQLMKWAIMCPNEFTLLLKKFKNVNDIQILEQLYGIAMCLCYKTTNERIINQILYICEEEFFEGDNIKIYDFQIRTYIRSIAERAFQFKILKKQELKKFLPPYKCKKNFLLDREAAINGTRMGGYKIINYDLSRYVLCDYLEHRFFYHFNEYDDNEKIKLEHAFSKKELLLNKDNFVGCKEYEDSLLYFNKERKLEDLVIDDEDEENDISKKSAVELRKIIKEIEEDYKKESNNTDLNDEVDDYYGKKTRRFLKKEARKIRLNTINEDQFIIAGAYQYILDQGWNAAEFSGNGKIDSEIIRHYHYATHGGKSGIMSFSEKYIWCYRNEILGYLADNLYKNKEEKEKYKNYADIDDVLIPSTEFEQTTNDEKEFCETFLDKPVFTDTIFEDIEEIKEWIKDPNIQLVLENWIHVVDDKDNKYLTLSSYNSFLNIKNDIELNMWISAGIIKEDNIKYLKDNIECNQRRLYGVVDSPDHFVEYTVADGAKTPLEIINFEWYDRKESEWENISLLNNSINRYNIDKSYESPYNVHTEFVEVHYKIPSYKIRKIMKINNCEGFIYKNHEEVVSYYETNNKAWDDFHDILVVKRDLEQKLKRRKEKLVWFIRIDKCLNSLGREKYKDIYDRNSILSICWFENEKLVVNFIKKNDNEK